MEAVQIRLQYTPIKSTNLLLCVPTPCFPSVTVDELSLLLCKDYASICMWIPSSSATQGHQSLSSLSIFSSLLGYSYRHTHISHSKQNRTKTKQNTTTICLTPSPRTVTTPFPYSPLRQHSLKYFSILHILHLRSSLETTPFRLLSLPLFRGT